MPTAHERLGADMLLDATAFKNVGRMTALLAGGADPNIGDERGHYPLHVATSLGRLDMVQLLLVHGAEATSRVMPGGEALIFMACVLGHAPIVKELIGAGANFDERDVDGLNVMHVLARDGSTEVLIELIQAGAQLDARDNNGYAPIHHAAETGNLPALHELVRAGSSHAWRSNNFQTPLAVACMCGYSTLVEYLLDNCRADPSAVNGARQTPLAVATRLGHLEVVKVLLRCGVCQLGPTAYGDALCGMAMSGNVEILRELIHAEGGVHVRGAKTPANYTALHMSAGYCHPLATSMLLHAGVDENATTFAGRTTFGIVNDMQSEFVQNGTGAGRVRRMLAQAPAFRARSWMWPDTVATPPTSESDAEESPTRTEGAGSAEGATELVEVAAEHPDGGLDPATSVATASTGTIAKVSFTMFRRPVASSSGSKGDGHLGLVANMIRYAGKP